MRAFRLGGVGLAVGLVAWAILAGIVRAQTPPEEARARSIAEIESATDRAVNAYRAQQGLRGLVRTSRLDDMAQQHCRDMAIRGFAAHDAPGGSGMVDRAAANGIAFLKIGENIARTRGAIDPVRRVVDGWIHSPSHRANLLDPAFTDTGIGVAVDGKGTVYFTQVFLRPMP